MEDLTSSLSESLDESRTSSKDKTSVSSKSTIARPSETSIEKLVAMQDIDSDSDSEDYAPSSDVSDSSLETDKEDSLSSCIEEEGVSLSEAITSGVKFYKLKFADIEAACKKHCDQVSEESDVEGIKDKPCCSQTEKASSGSISGVDSYSYRTLLNSAAIDDYRSDEDEDFNPMYCGETLSDDELNESDEKDMESELEIESLKEMHKKTGEPLKCIKMMEDYLTVSADASVDDMEC